MPESESTSTARRLLNREAWLHEALEILSREGEGKLRIDGICRALGVTKGSFYHHFRDREEFLLAIVEYWFQVFTRRVPPYATEGGGDAADQLRRLFEMVTRENLVKYDVPFEAWAAHEPAVLPAVKEVHRYRYRFVSSLFRKLGFSGSELKLRTVAFLAYLKADPWVTGTERTNRSREEFRAALEFFTAHSRPG